MKNKSTIKILLLAVLLIYTSELIAETDVNIVNFVLIIFRLGLILLVIFIFFAIFRRS